MTLTSEVLNHIETNCDSVLIMLVSWMNSFSNSIDLMVSLILGMEYILRSECIAFLQINQGIVSCGTNIKDEGSIPVQEKLVATSVLFYYIGHKVTRTECELWWPHNYVLSLEQLQSKCEKQYLHFNVNIFLAQIVMKSNTPT